MNVESCPIEDAYKRITGLAAVVTRLLPTPPTEISIYEVIPDYDGVYAIMEVMCEPLTPGGAYLELINLYLTQQGVEVRVPSGEPLNHVDEMSLEAAEWIIAIQSETGRAVAIRFNDGMREEAKRYKWIDHVMVKHFEEERKEPRNEH